MEASKVLGADMLMIWFLISAPSRGPLTHSRPCLEAFRQEQVQCAQRRQTTSAAEPRWGPFHPHTLPWDFLEPVNRIILNLKKPWQSKMEQAKLMPSSFCLASCSVYIFPALFLLSFSGIRTFHLFHWPIFCN